MPRVLTFSCDIARWRTTKPGPPPRRAIGPRLTVRKRLTGHNINNTTIE
jgi:hypothetical protein